MIMALLIIIMMVIVVSVILVIPIVAWMTRGLWHDAANDPWNRPNGK